jgi:hypothetical protein
MIQRIQTLWLMIITLSSGFLMKGGIIKLTDLSGQSFQVGFSGVTKISESGNELISGLASLSVLIPGIAVLSLICIFLFRSRRIQKVLALTLIAFSLCMIIVLSYHSIILMKKWSAEIIPVIKMALPLVILASSILAYRGISNDEKLVKSYDRLR